MAMARKASVTKSKLGMVIYGEQFTGKSTMASQLAYFKNPETGKPFRVLYLDPESGSIDDYLGELENNGVNLNNIYIVYTQSLAEVNQYIAKVKNHEDFYELDEDGMETDEVVLDADNEPFRADAIVIDGTTILRLTTQQGLIEFSKKRNKVKAERDGLVGDEKLVKIEGASLEIKDYGMINFRGQDLILALTGCGVHYVVTAREEDEKISVKDSKGQISSISTGKKKISGFKDMGYNAKTVVRMFRDENGNVCAHVEKDRTHVFPDNSILEDPTLLAWQAALDKTAKAKDFIVKNNLTKSVEIEQELYSREVLGSVGEPVEKTSKSEQETAPSADDLRKEINSKIKALAPPEKIAMKKKLQDAGLPTAFKTVTDAEVLSKVLKTIG